MHFLSLISLSMLAVFFTGAIASPPAMDNYNLIWSDDFNGAAGQVDQSKWNYETPATNPNNEKQKYTDSAANGGISGCGTLRITPLKSSSGQWTSARLTSWSSFTCEVDHKMIIQAEIKLGENANQQGIWPAFWALGASINSGNSWLHSGE
jgi:beta-glucanase (GH16 family)